MSAELLSGRTIYIPRMPSSSAQLVAAAFRGNGLDARITPPSDERTTELGLAHCSGEECFPVIITLGDFLKILLDEHRDPRKTAFFMPTSSGPCRFGQYAPYIRSIFKRMGFEGVPIVSPTSSDAYDGMGAGSNKIMRSAWWGIVVSDLLTTMLLRIRPYERDAGSADGAFDHAIHDVESILENPSTTGRLPSVLDAARRARDYLRDVVVRKERYPTIGVVGEIFCRNNAFSNMDIIRKFERYRAECWHTGLREWVHYSNREEKIRIQRRSALSVRARLSAAMRHRIQYDDERKITDVFCDDILGREEPSDIDECIEHARPYLPSEAGLGEMLLSLSRILYMHSRGVSGVIDISPFTCMNAIVAEAIYPKLSRDLGGLPIRSFYFDGTQSDLSRDIGVFLASVETYTSLQSGYLQSDLEISISR